MRTKTDLYSQTDVHEEEIHVNSEEIHEIITAVPSWILRRGVALIASILLGIIIASAFIRYPDVVKANLKINSLNAPKAVFVKQTGKIVALVAREGDHVKQGEPLAFMESTAKHTDVLQLHGDLVKIRKELDATGSSKSPLPTKIEIGELQGTYQSFYQQYLQYVSAQAGGYYTVKKKSLERDLLQIQELKKQILDQETIQNIEYSNLQREFEAYQKLYEKGVISTSEYKQQENKFLSGKYPLQQSAIALLNNSSALGSKEKEMLEVDHTIQDEKSNFFQSLNNMITETDSWINKYILIAPVDGTLSYAGIVQENQSINAGQELFMVNPANMDFFGEIYIPQYNMGKIRLGQNALIKMKSYPFEQFGLIRGKINYISDVAFKDSVFVAKIALYHFENKDPEYRIVLKNGMQADAEIITEDCSLLQRFFRNLRKMMQAGA